ncbi:SDR family oxidoreductase [Streptomyces yatensis]|uniref:SDR family oxidoreductase n=1 Tax=Streptomyces yatensis TaxID=155177 RepID=UPI001FE9F3E0|nr:SDR family oxidoreductase [Streptomyces yatensis]
MRDDPDRRNGRAGPLTLPGRSDVLHGVRGGAVRQVAHALRRGGLVCHDDPFDADGKTDLAAFARDFRANLDANLISAALTARVLNDRLAPGGAVIHIGSIAADQGADSYGASKAGLATWDLSPADALEPRDITANVVAPGYITDTECFRDQPSDKRRTSLIAATSTGRPGTPADVAGAVAFRASPAARHIRGQVLNVNGGARKTR